MFERHRGVLSIAIILFLIAVPYLGLVWDGQLPPPRWDAIVLGIEGVVNHSRDGAGTLLITAIAIVVLLAALAPLVFAIRSGDIVTILVCAVLVTLTWIIALNSRTSIDLALAGIVYLASLTLSAVVFSAHKIGSALDRTPRL